MSVASTELDAAIAAAAAVIRCLPAPDLTPGNALHGPSALDQAVVAPGSKAVSAALAGDVNGKIVLVVVPDLAAQVENGPVGPQDFIAGMSPALEDAVTALGQSLGTIRHEAAQALDAEVAVAGNTSENITVVPLVGAAGPAGAVVVILDTPEAPPKTNNTASFESLSATLTGAAPQRAVELLNDVEMGVTAELGRTRMTIRELLSMQPGSIVELDRAAGSPVDLLVNGTLVARGEVVVIDEEFGVRVTEIIGYDAKKTGQ